MPEIVVVDDEQNLADNLVAILKNKGFDAKSADLSVAVIDDLVASPPDLVVLDVMAPDDPAAGFVIARKIRATEAIAKLPIIMLTAVNQALPADFSEKDIEDVWMPVQAFLEKPANPDILVSKINAILGN